MSGKSLIDPGKNIVSPVLDIVEHNCKKDPDEKDCHSMIKWLSEKY